MTKSILQNCEDERIQFLNEIQPFGYLIGVDRATLKIHFVSQNVEKLFKRNAEKLLNVNLEEVHDFQLNLDEISQIRKGDYLRNYVSINDKEYHLTIYNVGDFIYLELEECSFSEDNSFYYKTSEKILLSKSIDDTWNFLLDGIKKIIGYDRVMLYSFLEDKSGIVLKENISEGLEPYLGLRYPEFDIPKQARNLYLKKKSRIVSDVDAPRIPIISNSDFKIDLTYTWTRALSPIHLEYLRNANACASFSISIVVNNKLWGIVTCQNENPKHIPYQTRTQCELLTRLARIAYINFKNLEKLDYQNRLKEIAVKLKENLLIEENLNDSIKRELKGLLKLTEADGMAFVNFEKILIEGETPCKEEILRIKDWAQDKKLGELYHSNIFKRQFGEQLELSELSTGVMFSLLDKPCNNFIIWFKKKDIMPINWAGEPQKIKTEKIQPDGTKVICFSPRTSFKFWQEQVDDKSFIWKEQEIYVAREVIKIIIETLHIQSFKIRALYEQLKEINEELDAFSYTVSHDLRTPLTVMKLNCQLLQKKLFVESNQSDHLEKIIEEIDRVTEMMENILALSKVKKSDIVLSEIETESIIKKIVSDLKIYYNSHKTSIKMEGLINILAEKTMTYDVFLNIIGNAIKYSSLKDRPQISIYTTQDDEFVTYSIKDNGIGILKDDYHKMFKLFSRMSNTSGIKGNGIGLTIAQTMMKRMGGDVFFTSKEGEGTTFNLKFRKP